METPCLYLPKKLTAFFVQRETPAAYAPEHDLGATTTCYLKKWAGLAKTAHLIVLHLREGLGQASVAGAVPPQETPGFLPSSAPYVGIPNSEKDS